MSFSEWRLPRRIAGMSRVFCYSLFVTVVCALLAGRVVYADLSEGSLRAGRELESLNDVLGTTKTIFLNGAPLNVSTTSTDQTPGEVLDRFEAVCRSHPDLMARAVADIPGTLLEKAKVDTGKLWRLGVVRKEAEGEGALACLTDERATSLSDLMGRLKAFEQSGDVTAFGRFRYVYARQGPHGTHVRTVWTDGEFKLDKMFPSQGDAAGFDSAEVPRPPAAKRILSATSADVPFGVHIYRTSQSRESLRLFYDQQLGDRDWKRVPEESNTTVYSKNGAMSFVTLTPKGADTLVTITETASQQTPVAAQVHLEP